MKNQRKLTTYLLGSITALALPASAHETWLGPWQNNVIQMSASASSFPVGSALRESLQTVVDRFYYEQCSEAFFELSFDDTSVDLGNGQNEVWFSSDPEFGPAECQPWIDSSGNLVETDIIFYSGVSYTTSMNKLDGLSYGGSDRTFETTAMHEFGHAANLDHEADEYNIMGTDWTHISCNGSTVRSYVGEDAAFGLSMMYGYYSGPGTIEDLGVTLFRHSGSSGEYSAHAAGVMRDSSGNVLPSNSFDGQRRYLVEAGDQVQVEFTYENMGQTYQSDVTTAFYLSSNNYISTADTLIMSTTLGGLGTNSVWSGAHTITLPSDLAPGTLHLGVRIDDQSLIGEATESNNAAYHIIEVVASCSDSLEPNDSMGTATSVGAGTFSLSICDDDEDWIAVGLDVGQSLEAIANFSHANGDIDIQLLSPAGQLVDLSASVSDQETVSMSHVEHAGTYFLRVFGFSGATNDYTLSVSIQAAPSSPTLTADAIMASIGSTQTVAFDLATDPQHVGDYFMILGTAAGPYPGVTISGVHYPLNPDSYTHETLGWLNVGPYVNTFGIIGPDANESASMTLTAPVFTGIDIGTTLHHAALIFDISTLRVIAASNAEPLVILP